MARARHAHTGECRLLQTLLEDHGFELTASASFNLLWLNCPVKPALLLGLNKYQKVMCTARSSMHPVHACT